MRKRCQTWPLHFFVVNYRENKQYSPPRASTNSNVIKSREMSIASFFKTGTFNPTSYSSRYMEDKFCCTISHPFLSGEARRDRCGPCIYPSTSKCIKSLWCLCEKYRRIGDPSWDISCFKKTRKRWEKLSKYGAHLSMVPTTYSVSD